MKIEIREFIITDPDDDTAVKFSYNYEYEDYDVINVGSTNPTVSALRNMFNIVETFIKTFNENN